MKTLIIAEKPSVGKDIARVLECKNSSNGLIESSKYIVTWAMGHLVTLADPEIYNEKYKIWNLENLPIIPDKFKLVVIKQTAKQYNIIKNLINRNDVNNIIIATDAGREGELVARLILIKSGNKKPIKRLWISSVTDKAIKEGFNNLKDGNSYMNLFYSAFSRAKADWIVGINASRALTSKYNAQLSCGRVQTPTLAIIEKREEDIRNFKSVKYYKIEAMSKNLKLLWNNNKTNENRIFSKEDSEKIINSIKTLDGEVISIEKKSKKALSPQLYDLTELQRDANNYYDFSAKETLSIMQSLYEKHKVLTYPRTDSRYLTKDIIETIPERLKSIPKEFFKFSKKILQNKIKANSNFVDDKKVGDHHAIIPTEQPVYYDMFTDKEKKIYDLVVKRFLSVLYPPFEYEQTTIKVKIGEEIFTAKGNIIISEGYKEIYKNDKFLKSDDFIMPDLKKGDILNISSINLLTENTSPPSRFNEASLLSAMENPAKYMETNNSEYAKALNETGGLGTVATRADIIEKLFNAYLIEKKGKEIYITSKGRQLLSLSPKELKSPEMTAKWELKLNQISKGNLNKDIFISDIEDYTKKIINDIKSSGAKFRHDNITGTKCPQCGKYMLQVTGKKGKMLVCQDRECNYKKSVSLITNSRCPQCHKKLELVGEGEGRKFVCICGYREKFSSFQERKKAESNKMDKKSVQKYLNKLNNDKEINNPMKDILSQLKL